MRPGKRVLPGRHALFSGGDPGAAAAVPAKRNGTARAPLAGMTRPPVAARPARLQKATAKNVTSAGPTKTVKAIKSTKTVKAVRSGTVPNGGDRGTRGGRGGPIGLSCSKCGTQSDVNVLKYLVLHMPFWVWRPGRGYTSLMKCPACGKRAWISASWGPGQD